MKYIITDADTGLTYPCDESESVFGALHRSGRSPIRGGCAGGGCGFCKIRILEGAFVQFKPMSKAHISDEDISRKIVLACCVKPVSDITLTRKADKTI